MINFKEKVINNLKFWEECLENPPYNSLEVGFRHSPLTHEEIIKRYKEECDFVRNSISRFLFEIEDNNKKIVSLSKEDVNRISELVEFLDKKYLMKKDKMLQELCNTVKDNL